MSCYTANFKGNLKLDSEIDKISTVDKLLFENLHNKDLID